MARDFQPHLLAAINFAAERHTAQRRKGSDDVPYVNHVIAVAHILVDVGDVDTPEVLMAAILHDTVEDTDTTPEEIEAHFGPVVRRIVAEVTDDKTLPKQERKRLQIEHAPHISHEAKLVKLADKISNVTDVTDVPPTGWSIERRIEYVEWAGAVVDGLRGASIALESHFDEVVIRARRALGPDDD